MVRKIFLYSLLAVGLTVAPFAQARIGGGRSFGSRGSRALSPHYVPSTPRRSVNPTYPYRGNPYRPAPSPFEPRYGGGNSFWHGLAGGLAGGFLGSLLFRGLGGGAYAPAPGGGFFGLFEILLLAIAAFVAIRWWRQRQVAETAGPYFGPGPTPIYAAPAEEEPISTEDVLTVLSRYQPGFNLDAFKESRTDDFFRLQAAFMARDLSPVRNLIAPEATAEIESDLAALKARGHINRLENITVRQTDVLEAWQELGKEYATIHFRANLLDYTVDEKSGNVVEGSRTEPVKFEEYWTFVRGIGFAPEFNNWRLSAIEQA